MNPNDPNSFAEWLTDARAGSEGARGRVLEHARKYLLKIAEHELGSAIRPKEGASDMVQDSIIEANFAFGQFHGTNEAELLAWLRAILRNNVCDVTRKYRKGRKRRLDLERPLTAHDINLPGASVSGDSITSDERIQQLRTALTQLSSEDRTVIDLHRQGDLSWEAIGHAMHRTGEAARKLHFRAVERLRQMLQSPSRAEPGIH